MLSLLSIVTGGLIGFFSAVFAAPLRDRLFRPKLELTFTGDADCVSKSTEMRQLGPEPQDAEFWEAIYLRCRVTNRSRRVAKSCTAYLVGVEKDEGHGNFEPTVYADSIPLAWSCRGDRAYSEIDIPHGVSQYVDVLKTNDKGNHVFPQWESVPMRYFSLLSGRGRYRLTVLVSGDGVDPVRLQIVFVWKGQWDTFEACLA